MHHVLEDAAPAAPAGTIAFHVPALPDVDAFLEDVRSIVESGWLSEGRFVRRLEAVLATWLGGPDVVAVSNCSDGMIAALSVAADPGCEVIIPGFTYLATWQSVIWAGMVPVVVDVDDRGRIDPAAVRAAISSRTGAILAVHLAGSPAPGSRSSRTAPMASERDRATSSPEPSATSRYSASARQSRWPRARAAA